MCSLVITLFASPLLVTGTLTTTLSVPGIGNILSNKLDGGITESLGIRYAAPPTGANRFRPPQPLKTSGSDLIDATSYGPACMQSINNQSGDLGPLSEDCLSLNIWAPPESKDGQLLPVFFWIHGGGFLFGSGDLYNSTNYAQQGVVAVSINYRLGAFGFLESEEIAKESPDAPGNGAMNGFLDQVAALQWVRKHISSFGGDPQQVTIGGESAGSISTCVHLHLPASKGLFHRAILESGSCTAGSPWGMWNATDHRINSAHVFQDLGAKSLVDLRKIDAEVILKTPLYMRCGPAPDGFHFKVNPSQLSVVSKGLEVIIGSNTMDTLQAPPYNASAPEIPDLAPKTADAYTSLVTSYFGKDVLKLYPSPPEGAAEQDARNAFYRINSDVCNTCPKLWAAGKYVMSDYKVYMYEFGFYSKAPLKGLACHACELSNIFGGGAFDSDHLPEGLKMMHWSFDKSLATDMQSYWSSFIKSGVPTHESVWPIFNSTHQQDQQFLNIATGPDGKPLIKIGQAKVANPGCDFFSSFLEHGSAEMDPYTVFGMFCNAPGLVAPHFSSSEILV